MPTSLPPTERSARDGRSGDYVPLPSDDNRLVFAHTVYALYAAGFLGYITAIIGVVIAWWMKERARDTWLESHIIWQVRTFWYGVLLNVVGWLTVWILIGWLILLLTQAWYVWRIAKGWIRLAHEEPIRSPQTFL